MLWLTDLRHLSFLILLNQTIYFCSTLLKIKSSCSSQRILPLQQAHFLLVYCFYVIIPVLDFLCLMSLYLTCPLYFSEIITFSSLARTLPLVIIPSSSMALSSLPWLTTLLVCSFSNPILLNWYDIYTLPHLARKVPMLTIKPQNYKRYESRHCL